MLREIYAQHIDPVLTWIRSPLFQRWMQDGRLVETQVIEEDPGRTVLLEHKRIFFPSYPWEWTPGQWEQAGSLTLDLCTEAIDQNYILKDATPLNILYTGSRPVFVDIPSFEKRDPHSQIWLAYAQFVRTFLLPLAAYTYLGWPLSSVQQRSDGYEPAMLSPWLSYIQRWSNPFRALVTLPLLLEKGHIEKKSRAQAFAAKTDPELATHLLKRVLRRTRKMLAAVTPKPHVSRWSEYTSTACHYGQNDHSAKQDFVARMLSEIHPKTVLDVGANTGVYSRIAAAAGASVVAWDTDTQAAEINFQTAREKDLPILPLIADFARPTPAVGWRNRECQSLLARAKGRFDCIMMLGVIHHLLVSNQIPLNEIVEQLAEITTKWAIVEWVPKNDSQFVELCRGREYLYESLDEALFLKTAEHDFRVRHREQLSNERVLFLLEKTQ